MIEMKPQTKEEIWVWAADMLSGEGPSRRGQYQAVPVFHILSDLGSEAVMWCSGGASMGNETPLRRRMCPTCLRLARDMLEDLWEPDDPEKFVYHGGGRWTYEG